MIKLYIPKSFLGMFSRCSVMTLFVLTTFATLAMLDSTRYNTLMKLYLCELCAKFKLLALNSI